MVKLIKHSGPKQKKVAKKEVATLLGAEILPEKTCHKKGPTSIFALREFTRKRLQSTGGRPSLENVEKKRRKVSFMEGDFIVLEEMATSFSDEHRKVTPSQLVACIVHKELKKTGFAKA